MVAPVGAPARGPAGSSRGPPVERAGHAVDELGGLQPDQATVLTELDQVAVDLLGDTQDHLGGLHHADHVAHRHRVLDLQDRQAAEGHVEPAAEALHGVQGLVGPVVQPPDGLDGVLLVVAVDGDDRHGGRHRDDRHVDRAGHPLGRSVPGARLRGGDGGLGHQVHVGPGDAGGVAGQDDGPVHLRQLGEALRAELGVEQEAARADGQHARAVSHHDQGAPRRPGGCGPARHAAVDPERPWPGRQRAASSDGWSRTNGSGRQAAGSARRRADPVVGPAQ